MKILFIHTYYKEPGGEDSVVKNELELLHASGHSVNLLAFNNTSNTLMKVFFMLFNPASYKKVIDRIKAFQPDVIHVHNLHFGASPSVIYAAKKMRVPVVMTVHNFRLLCPSGSLFFNNRIFTDSLKEPFPWSAVRKGVYQQSKLITFWLAMSNYFHRKIGTWSIIDTMIFLGEHSKNIFIQSGIIAGKTKVVVKPNFTIQKPQTKENMDGDYFLYVGRLTEDKGILTLLKAFERQTSLLKIVGTGPLKDLVIKAAAENSNIEYLGQLAKADVETIMLASKAIVFPSEWFETFGMVLIEAFSLGKPVIAADLGNVTTIVKNKKNGLTFEAGNFDSLKKCLTAFDRLSAIDRANLSSNALNAYQDNFSPEVNLAQLSKIYSSAIEN